MIPYHRDPRQIIPSTAVKIIGLGGAGTNMLERIALDGMEGAELLAINTDIRTLGSCLAPEKIQLGVNLTKGLGAGGDPELGHQAVLEAEDAIRAAVTGRRIVFLCTGLGGGTGSGAAPIVTRIAREEGAFVVVFATMPFAFEGRRRRDQAETALNELVVLSNALVTFDNNRMGELVLAKQGIHDAFLAADQMICESMKAVIRLVIRPGLINVGLDDLMSALRTNRSRCLFGSGIATGKDRATRALRNALSSPLLDQGSLLKDARTVLVHLCGGEDLTLFEIELLMQSLQKFVPEEAHVLFGAAVDPAMGDALSLTLISALPEDSLAMAPRDSLSLASRDKPLPDPAPGVTPSSENEARTVEPQLESEDLWKPVTTPAPDADAPAEKPTSQPVAVAEFVAVTKEAPSEACVEAAPDPQQTDEEAKRNAPGPGSSGGTPIPKKRAAGDIPWSVTQGPKSLQPELAPIESFVLTPPLEPEGPKLKLGIKPVTPQSELSLDSTPRGRFEGETPNVIDGEDLDLPPFLRKKK
jgi:cell division protein FtsZ